MDVQYRQLGATDLQVSSIGLGCVTFGREIDEETSLAVVDHAIDRGINLLDTAAVYGEGASEEILGRWMRLRSNRDHVVLATKVSGRLTSDLVVASVEASLKRFATDRIDLLQAHDWDKEDATGRDAGGFRRPGSTRSRTLLRLQQLERGSASESTVTRRRTELEFPSVNPTHLQPR